VRDVLPAAALIDRIAGEYQDALQRIVALAAARKGE
jgi:hypothetical protein